ARAVQRARLRELPRVVARGPADDDDDVGRACHVDGGRLALLGRAADGVDEADVGVVEAPPDARAQAPHLLDRLRGLCGDAQARTRRQSLHLAFVEHYVE